MADTSAALWIVCNLLSAVTLIICNKALMSYLHFHFVYLLTACHMVVQYAYTLSSKSMPGPSDPLRNKLPTAMRVGVGTLNIASIALMNASLEANSVGFYQLAKLSLIPVTILMERVLQGKSYPWTVHLALVAILGGLGIVTVTDAEVRLRGLLIACLAVLVTAAVQAIAGIVVACIGDLPSLVATETSQRPTAVTWLVVLASCLCAIAVNVTTAGVLGTTSPVTFQVSGHFKTIAIIVAGYLVFPPEAPLPLGEWLRQAGGIGLAFCGVLAYTYLKTRQQQPQHLSKGDAWVPLAVVGEGGKRKVSDNSQSHSTAALEADSDDLDTTEMA